MSVENGRSKTNGMRRAENVNRGFENGHLVPTESPASYADELPVDFDYEAVESPEIKALVSDVRAQCAAESREDIMDAVKWTLAFLIEAKDSRRAAYQLAYACGMGAMIGGSAAEVARKFGISREAFEQEGSRMLESLFTIRKAPNEKRADASKTYSLTNFRNSKPK